MAKLADLIKDADAAAPPQEEDSAKSQARSPQDAATTDLLDMQPLITQAQRSAPTTSAPQRTTGRIKVRAEIQVKNKGERQQDIVSELMRKTKEEQRAEEVKDFKLTTETVERGGEVFKQVGMGGSEWVQVWCCCSFAAIFWWK